LRPQGEGADRLRIAPSILSCDFARLGDEIRAVEEGGADWIHVDVMDGHFVPNITIGPVVTRGARRSTRLPLDVHLMIEEPDRYLEAFAEAGATVLSVHQEACRHLHRTLERIRELGLRAGVALNPATPLESVRNVLPLVDVLLVMSVNPGFGGQSYIPTSTEKIRQARSMLDEIDSGADLEVDGGVTAENAAEIAAAGATVLVAGSAVYRHPEGAAAGVRALRGAVSG
jgi:ribulose-phosphate 3-epimerase